jgi:hypothetical protein
VETCNACGAVPLAEVADSHEESLLAVNIRLPPPILVIFTVVAGGFVPLPCVALKERVDCETERIGPEVVALP